MKSILAFSSHRPWIALLIAGVVVLLSVISILRLKPETSLNAILDPTDPATAAMTKVLAQFPVAEEMLVLISLPEGQAGDREALLTTAQTISDRLLEQKDLVRSATYRPSVQMRQFFEQVMGPAGLYYLDDSQLVAAREKLTPAAMRAQFQKNEAMLAAPGPAVGGIAKAILQDPLHLHELLISRFQQLPGSAQTDGYFSPSGRDLLIRIEGTKPPSDLDFCGVFTRRVSDIVRDANTVNLETRITGAYAITAHNAALIRGDAIQDSASSVILLAIIFTLLYRKPLWVFVVAFTPIAVGIVCGFGIYALFRETITPLAAVIGGAMGGIGIDYSTHMLAHFRRGGSPVELVRRLAMPLLAACITSVIGFAVIGWSPLQLLRDFAIVGSLTLFGAFVAAIFLLPALLSLRATDPGARFHASIRDWSRPGRVATISAALLLPFIVIASGVNLQQRDPDLHNLHPQPNPPLDAQRDLSRRMGMNSGSMIVYVRADSSDDLLKRCSAVEQGLRQYDNSILPKLTSVLGPTSLLPSPDVAIQRQHAFSDSEVQAILISFDHSVTESAFEAKAYAPYRSFLQKLLQPISPPGIKDLKRFPELAGTVLASNANENAAAIHLTFDQPLEQRHEVERAIGEIHTRIDSVPGATLTGLTVIGQQTLSAVRRDLPRVALLAGGLVTLYLVIHYRSLELALLAVLPTIVSLILLLAAMRIFGITLNIVNLVMVPLLLGINIDFGIFAVDTLRHAEEESLRDQFVSSLRAMFTCAITAVIGFGSLAFTSIPAVRSLGWLVNVGVIGCCLGATFVLWPIVLMIARRRGMR